MEGHAWEAFNWSGLEPVYIALPTFSRPPWLLLTAKDNEELFFQEEVKRAVLISWDVTVYSHVP